jgi:hypothetical protein
MSNKQLAVVANGFLVFGVFCPIVTIPFLGGQNYFQNGAGDGSIVLALAAIGFLLIWKNRFRELFITGGLSLLVCIYTFITLLFRLNELRDKMHSDLKDNPFGGLAEAAMQSVQIQWGWILLIGGAVTVMIAAWNCCKEQQLAGVVQKRSENFVEAVNPVTTETSNTSKLSASVPCETNPLGIKKRTMGFLVVAVIFVFSILVALPFLIDSDSFADFLIMMSPQSGTKVGSGDNKQAPSQNAAQTASVPVAVEPAPGWEYHTNSSDAGAKKVLVGCLESKDELRFESPYKNTVATLCFRSDGGVWMSIGSGQLLSGDSHGARIRVGDAAPRSYSLVQPSDYSSDAAFIVPAGPVFAAARSGKNITVEATYYGAGRQSVTFRPKAPLVTK